MSGFFAPGGVRAVPQGDGWLLLEADRPVSEGLLGRVQADGGRLVVQGGPDGLPTGPYGSIDAVIEAVQAWRSRRF